MQSLRLRALTRKGEPYLFEPADVPVRIWEDAFILARKPESPILKLHSVVRVMDHNDLGEGDCVLIDGKVYTVRYFRGFYFEGADGEKIPSHQVTHCEVFSIGTETLSRIQFRSKNCAFQLYAFLGCYNGKVLVSHDPKPVPPEDIKVSAGFVYLGQKLCYGDMVEDKPLIMWHGRPCIKTVDGYLEIPTHTLLAKEY